MSATISIAKACELGLEGIVSKQKPQLAKDKEPGFRQDVIHAPRRHHLG
jgi:hypothetical protein